MKKKKILFWVTFGFGSLLFVIFTILLINKSKQKATEEAKIQLIPKFQFEKLDGSLFSDNDLDKEKSTCIFYIDPDCHFCTNEVEEIIDKYHQFPKNVQLIFISYGVRDRIVEFLKRNKMDEFDNFTVLFDKRMQFSDFFGDYNIPTTFIYNKDRQLLKIYRGQTKVEAILKFIK